MKHKYAVLLFILFTMLLTIILFNFNSLDFNNKMTINNNLRPEKTTIRFLSSWGGTDTKAKTIQGILDRFQKENTDIKIVNESIQGEEFLFTLKTDFAQGNDPDVFGLWPGSDIKTLVQAGRVADLTDVFEEDGKWKDSFRKDTWDYVKYNNKIYGVPLEIIYEAMFLNQDLFDRYGVPIPRTYSELLNAVKVFKDNNIVPIAYNSTPEGSYIYQNMVMKLGGKFYTENPFIDGKLNQYYVDAIKYMKQLYDLGAFPSNQFSISNNDRNDMFLNKKAAMIVQGSWFIGPGALKISDSTVKLIPFPSFENGKADDSSIIYGLGNGSFHISEEAFKDKKKAKACIKLLKYITSESSVKLYHTDAGFMSGVMLNDYKGSGRLMDEENELVTKSREVIGPTDSFMDRNLWEGVLVKGLPSVFEGKVTPEKLGKEIEDSYYNSK